MFLQGYPRTAVTSMRVAHVKKQPQTLAILFTISINKLSLITTKKISAELRPSYINDQITC